MNKTYNNLCKEAYEQLLQCYAPSASSQINNWRNSDEIILGPSGLFPPQDFSSFESEAAEEAFVEYNCAIITACRGELSDSENEERNQTLIKDLHRLKKRNLLDFLYFIEGCYKQENREKPDIEKSIFVYGNNSKPDFDFFSAIYTLSRKWGQDSFLYKCAGDIRFAFFLYTNMDAIKANGLIKEAGQLRLDFPEEGPYTKLTAGTFKFQIEEPTKEQIEYSKHIREERKKTKILK